MIVYFVTIREISPPQGRYKQKKASEKLMPLVCGERGIRARPNGALSPSEATERTVRTRFAYAKKRATHEVALFAEREGFEPPVPLSMTVFKTVVIDHSTISPCF